MANLDQIMDYLADHAGIETTSVSALNGITGTLWLIKDKTTNTVRGYGYYRRSTDISTSTNIFEIPEGYRPPQNVQIPMMFATSGNSIGSAYYGYARSDGYVRQNLGATIRESLTVFEYSI